MPVIVFLKTIPFAPIAQAAFFDLATDLFLATIELLERDEFRMNRHRALAYCLSMIFSENRYPLFRIML